MSAVVPHHISLLEVRELDAVLEQLFFDTKRVLTERIPRRFCKSPKNREVLTWHNEFPFTYYLPRPTQEQNSLI